MSCSFVLYKGVEHQSSLRSIAQRLTAATSPEHFSFGGISLTFRDSNTGQFFEKNSVSLRLLLSDPDSISTTEIAEAIFKALSGDVSLPFETPSFIAYDQEQDVLWIYNGIPGLLPFYYYFDKNDTWVFTEAKVFVPGSPFPLKLREYSFFEKLSYEAGAASESIFQNILRLRPGEILMMHDTKRRVFFPPLKKKEFRAENAEEWADLLYEELCKKAAALDKKNDVGLALSGGYDSGSLAGIFHQKHIHFRALSIGTETINEFKEARLSAAYASAGHYTLTITPEEYMRSYFRCLYLNELNDPVIAEGFPGIYFSCKLGAQHCKYLFTGYGADIILGNLLNRDNVNQASQKMLERSSVTGEFAPFIADHFNISSYPLYLSPEIINLCFSIPGELKVKSGINKYVQRRMIEKYDLLPPALLDVPKKGLHTGAGLPTMFEEINGNNNIEFKRRFMFHALKTMFEEGTAPEACDAEQIKQLASL